MHPPLKMAHAGLPQKSQTTSPLRENSPEAIRESLKQKIDIIEIDVRKSRDGILFCYHGFPWPKFLLAWFLRFFKYKTIHSLTKASKLKDLTKIIHKNPGKTPILFLDIKDKRITAKEIRKATNLFPTKNLWIAPTNFRYLKKLKKQFSTLAGSSTSTTQTPTYVYNFYFLSPQRGMRKLSKAGIKIFKVLPWQLSPSLKKEASKRGLSYAFDRIFVSSDHKCKTIIKEYGCLWELG